MLKHLLLDVCYSSSIFTAFFNNKPNNTANSSNKASNSKRHWNKENNSYAYNPNKFINVFVQRFSYQSFAFCFHLAILRNACTSELLPVFLRYNMGIFLFHYSYSFSTSISSFVNLCKLGLPLIYLSAGIISSV